MSWVDHSLDKLGFVSRGKSKHRPRNDPILYGGQYPFIQTADVKHAQLYVTSHSQTYNDRGLDQSKLWPKDTLCITIAANIADTALLGYEACFPDSIIGFVADPDKCDVRYIKYYFDVMQAHYKKISQGAAQDNLSQRKLLSLKVPTPPVPVQRKIADYLTAYNDLIANNERRIELLEEAMHLLYREWFVHLRFPGWEEMDIVDGVPEGWEKRPLENVAYLNYGKSLTKKVRVEGDVMVYGSSGIVGTHNESLIDEPVIIVGRKGNVGSVYWSPSPCFPIDTVFYVSPEQSSLFIYHNLQYQNFINSDAAVPGLNRGYAHSLPVLWPDSTTLHDFEQIANPTYQQIQTLQRQNDKLKEARDALLPRLMSGRIEV